MKVILIAIISFSLLGKIINHNRLNRIHQRSDRIGPPGMQPISFFLPYPEAVTQIYEREKILRNVLY